MATVRLRLSGGPYDGETSTMDVTDANEPPEVYTAQVHGPHETVERVEYRRMRREPDGAADSVVWIYEVSGVPG